MRKEWRIPTLTGLLLIIIGLVVTAFLTNQVQRFLIKATPQAFPKEVKITNITESSFSVSYITSDVEVSGAVVYGETTALGKTAADDRVVAGSQQDRFFTHHISVRFLKPSTKYYFKIISSDKQYDNQGNPYTVTTGPQLAVKTSSYPVYGTILKPDKTPASGILVYLTVKNSSPLSTLVKSSGNWLIAANQARSKDLSSYIDINAKGDAEEIFVQGGPEGIATAKTVTGKDAPVPNIVLGQTYDFSSMPVSEAETGISSPKATLTLTPTPTISSGFIGSTPSSSLSIMVPTNKAKLNDSQPTFTGTGKPGEVITITVYSSEPYIATVVVGPDGRWSWTPPKELTAGEHTVTIATSDQSGKPVQVSQNFTVLSSGSSITESATPSATLTPTFTPTPSASPAALPQSGNTLATSLLFVAGMAILILGGLFFYASAF